MTPMFGFLFDRRKRRRPTASKSSSATGPVRLRASLPMVIDDTLRGRRGVKMSPPMKIAARRAARMYGYEKKEAKYILPGATLVRSKLVFRGPIMWWDLEWKLPRRVPMAEIRSDIEGNMLDGWGEGAEQVSRERYSSGRRERYRVVKPADIKRIFAEQPYMRRKPKDIEREYGRYCLLATARRGAAFAWV